VQSRLVTENMYHYGDIAVGKKEIENPVKTGSVHIHRYHNGSLAFEDLLQATIEECVHIPCP